MIDSQHTYLDAMTAIISPPMAADALPGALASRRHQMFPVLTEAEIARIQARADRNIERFALL